MVKLKEGRKIEKLIARRCSGRPEKAGQRR
jgi:hypothetical protein